MKRAHFPSKDERVAEYLRRLAEKATANWDRQVSNVPPKPSAIAITAAASYAPRLDIAVGPFNPTFQDRERDANAIRSVRHPLVQMLEAEVHHQTTAVFISIAIPAASLLSKSSTARPLSTFSVQLRTRVC